MKILQIRFKNLNSLVGEWSIDFTHPEYSTGGIFAITGQTGSGKTTILDAICLALYGRTPRLKLINQSTNEIMSRQTGECFSEVVFETDAGRYRCHWSQHRSRKKPDGDLQTPKHEISYADSQKLIENKLSLVQKQVENLTGMDYQRFTRSMLLAQGEFAAFLEAEPKERAPILEQITGTEIYAQISIKIFERQREEKRKLEMIEALLANIKPLSLEDEQKLKNSLIEKLEQETALIQRSATLQKSLQALEKILELRKSIQKAEKERTQYQEQIKTREKILDNARQKLNLSEQYLQQHAADAALIADLTALGERFESLRKLDAERTERLKSGGKPCPLCGVPGKSWEEKVEQQYQTSHQEALQRLQPYGIQELHIPRLHTLLQELRKKRDTWQMHQEEKLRSEKELLKADTTPLQAWLAKLEEELQHKQQELKTISESLEGNTKEEELQKEQAACNASLRSLQQAVGALKQNLSENERLKHSHAEQTQRRDAQKKEALRWDTIHELIGSADGKKYRNFVQALTFQRLTAHANRQLQQMTERYLLLADGLELNVIDSYQSGEIRSTKNLSGGESFIVSLALSLGLSRMASQKVRVDSLFLDEGFGTLDDEALETALETLTNLQQTGKLVGVISHVPALKERIQTQIKVTPQSGGRSILCGPGVQVPCSI